MPMRYFEEAADLFRRGLEQLRKTDSKSAAFVERAMLQLQGEFERRYGTDANFPLWFEAATATKGSPATKPGRRRKFPARETRKTTRTRRPRKP